MLMIADATDPVATGSALSALGQVVQTALAHERGIPISTELPFEIRSTPATTRPARTSSTSCRGWSAPSSP